MKVTQDVGYNQQSAIAGAVKSGVRKFRRYSKGRRVDVTAVVGGIALHSIKVPVAYGLECEMYLAIWYAVIVDRIGASEERQHRGKD